VLKGTVAAFVMDVEHRQPLYEQQRTILGELADRLLDVGEGALDATFAGDWRAASTDEERRRVIVDQVASLSDHTAVAWHAQQVV
jgi:dGTPase